MTVTTIMRKSNARSAAGMKRAAFLLWAMAASYLASNMIAGWAARLLVGLARWQAGDAVILTSLTAIPACAGLVVWAFSHRRPARAMTVLLAWGLLGLVLDWLVPASFGSAAPGITQ